MPPSKKTDLKIGFPRNLDQIVSAKRKTLQQLLGSRARAWDGYFDTMSLAYSAAHKQHLATLNGIKEKIREQNEFFRTVVLGVLIPSFVGGGMAALIKDAGTALTAELIKTVTARQSDLISFGIAGGSTVVGDSVKAAVRLQTDKLSVQPGSEWDSVGNSPLEFFIKLRKIVNDYVTNVTYATEHPPTNDIQEYIRLLDAHLLSPFLQNAPMNTNILYSDQDLVPVMEVFLWVVWARERNTKYWLTQITRATEPDNRSFVGKIIDAGLKDDDALNRVTAYSAVRELAPILDRLQKCGISPSLITQGLAGKHDQRMLNILWVRKLGDRHKDTLLADLVANLDAKHPTSALEGGPITKVRRLM